MFAAGCFLLAATVVIITQEVFRRYVLGIPSIWALDVSRYIMVYITFLAAARLLSKDEHITIDIITMRVSGKFKYYINAFNCFIGTISCGILCGFSAVTCWDHLIRGLRVIDPIAIPKVIPLAIIPLGSFLLFFVFLQKFAQSLAMIKGRVSEM